MKLLIIPTLLVSGIVTKGMFPIEPVGNFRQPGCVVGSHHEVVRICL